MEGMQSCVCYNDFNKSVYCSIYEQFHHLIEYFPCLETFLWGFFYDNVLFNFVNFHERLCS